NSTIRSGIPYVYRVSDDPNGELIRVNSPVKKHKRILKTIHRGKAIFFWMKLEDLDNDLEWESTLNSIEFKVPYYSTYTFAQE
ncbi:hypothetical protein PENTCL1PPCAC_3720, partial [Pristionchus entomophagus]